MKPKIQKVFIPMDMWKAVHPVGLKCSSDPFYADLARFLASSMKTAFGTNHDITDVCFAQTAIDIAAYLEDKICGLNLWNSFIALYSKQYGRDFPFFSVDDEEILPDEPNLSDVRFLLWRGLNRSNPETLVNPLNPFIAQLAPLVFQTLCEAYENAPECNTLPNAVFNPELYNDPIIVRNICGWIAGGAYLTRVVNPAYALEPVRNMISTYVGDKLSKGQQTYFIDSYSSVSVLSGPLALPSYKWLAEMIRQSGNDWAEEAAAKLDQMKSLAILPYEITERTDEILTLRNIKGEKVLMRTDTMDPTVAVTTKQGEIIVSSLMFFDGYWHVNGMCTISQSNSSFDTDIEFHIKKEEMTKENYETVLNNNGGSPIGVAKDWDELSSRLKLDNADNNTENAAIAKRAKTMRNILYFINKDGNISILPDAAPLVKLPGNELYDTELATKQSCTLLFNLQASREMRAYLIDNKLLPDARLAGPLPDAEAKPWFAENEAFLEQAVNTDEVQISIP